jgi:hypothetical protein
MNSNGSGHSKTWNESSGSIRAGYFPFKCIDPQLLNELPLLKSCLITKTMFRLLVVFCWA